MDTSARIISQIATLAADGRYAAAYERVNAALDEAPTDGALLFAKGSVLLDWGRYGESRRAYEDAQRNGLQSGRLYRHLGWACFQGGDVESAERHLRQAVFLMPDDFDAQFCLGVVLQSRRRSDEACDAFARAVALRPNDFQANLMLGNCGLDQRDAAAAETCYRRATAIDSTHPSAWVNLGSALRQQGRLDDAIAAFERAYELERGNEESDTDAYLSVALGYADRVDLDRARDVLEVNLARRPSPQAHCNYAALLLQQGHFEEGWRHFEFRWMLDEKAFERPVYGKPVWSGQDLDGKTVLIRTEQGIGDTIQSLRYASHLKARGARVLLKAPAGLEQLGKHVTGLDAVLPSRETPLDFDFYVHSLGLARAFGTTLATIPAPIPYIGADPDRKSRWRARLGESGQVKVGLVWAGSPEHKRDRYRSIALASFAPLVDIEGVRFISLQKGPALDQLDGFAHSDRLLNLGPELEDLADTAAVIEGLDLVIGVDTAVVHLAGAMGRPVWTLVPTPSDWRWLLDRDDSPWYPTMRLFRQKVGGDWGAVVDAVRTALLELGPTNNGSKPEKSVLSVPERSTVAPTKSPPSGVFSAVYETRYGIIQCFPQPPTIERSLCLYGEYLELQIHLLRRLLGGNETIVEVAADCGVHAVALAALGHHVIACEAEPTMRRVLRQNVRTNKLSNVSVLPPNSAVRQKGSTSSSLSTLSLDALGLSQLGLVKVNDDTLADIIRGADSTLWRLRPMILAAGSEPNRNAFRDELVRYGYRCWHLQTPLYNPGNFNLRPENVFVDQTQAAILAIPEERDVDLPPECDEIR